MGDPAGIGPDIILCAYQDRTNTSLPPFYIVGCLAALRKRATALDINIAFTSLPHAAPFPKEYDRCPKEHDTHLFVRDIPLAEEVIAGQPSIKNASAIIQSIEMATDDVFAGRASSLVTAPINKAVLYQAGFKHAGHTMFLGQLAENYYKKKYTPVMMLASQELKVIPLTVHVPLKDVPGLLSQQLILDTARILVTDFQLYFNIKRPHIAVAGLNPHAGENGTMGCEEHNIIKPAIDILQAEGMNISGPYPADTLFHQARRQSYDVVLAMYHDQALIPLKTLAFDRGVNVSLGLPFIRTSPDHGTAYDIAGSGRAGANSFKQALLWAAAMVTSSQNMRAHDKGSNGNNASGELSNG